MISHLHRLSHKRNGQAGFEECYELLRDLRQTTKQPIIFIRQLEQRSPAVAKRLRERVSFDVPTTRSQACAKFFGHPTAQFICCALALALGTRARLGAATGADAIAGVATSIFWSLQEWAIHERLLHSKTPWFGRDIHRWHHELPYYHCSLDGIGIATAWFSVVALLLVSFGVLTSSLPECLTSLAVYTSCGLVYEAAHYLAHTRVPLPRMLNSIRQHHMRHHTLSERHWFAFTIPAVDTIFGTNPSPFAVSVRERPPHRQLARGAVE